MGVFKKELFENGPLKILAPIAELALSYAKVIESITLVLAVGVGAYTGFLLSAMNSYPLLNTPILPALFLASGVSAGISANLVVGLLFFKGSTAEGTVSYMHGLDVKVIFAELFFLFILFVGMMYQGGSSAHVAHAALSTGGLSTLLWVGVIGLGLIMPIGLNFALPHGLKHSHGFVIFNALIVLVGVLALRYYILYAGQTFVG